MYEVLSIKNFLVLDGIKQKQLVQEVVHSKEIHDSNINSSRASTNFKVLSDNSFFTELYEKLVTQCESIFGKLELSQYNSKACWGCCLNKDYWESVPHDHRNTSVINAVYYLSVPKIDGNYVGPFMYLNKNNEWVDYQVEPFELLIMPGNLMHNTAYHNSDEWRVSINMEIIPSNQIDFNLL